MSKGNHVGKKSITLVAAALLAGLVPTGLLPTPSYAQSGDGTVVVAGSTAPVGIAFVNGTILIQKNMTLAENSELAAGSFIASGSVLNGAAVAPEGVTLTAPLTVPSSTILAAGSSLEQGSVFAATTVPEPGTSTLTPGTVMAVAVGSTGNGTTFEVETTQSSSNPPVMMLSSLGRQHVCDKFHSGARHAGSDLEHHRCRQHAWCG
jgi:hypothetical protein